MLNTMLISFGSVMAGNWNRLGKALAQGAVGGAGSELGGGHFKDGFVGAFFAAAVSPLIKAIKSIEMKGALRTLAGGTASRLGGGKFASGATSAAMGFLFNEVLHAERGDGGSTAQEKPPAFMDAGCAIGLGASLGRLET